MPVEELSVSGAPAAALKRFEEVNRIGQVRFRHVHRRKDGSDVPVEISARRIEIGNRSYGLSFVRDISQQVEAERALQKNMLLLQTVFESVPVGLSVKDPERRYIMANQPILRLLQVDHDTMIGSRLEDLKDAHRWEADVIRRSDEHILQSGETVVTDDLRYRLPGESDRWGRGIKTPLRDETGAIVGIVNVSQDITHHRQMVTELQASEERLRQFSEASADWLWEMDQELRYTWMSDNVERIIGVSPEWHYGKTMQALRGDEFDHDAWARQLATMGLHKPFRDFVLLRQAPGQDPRWIRTSGVPFHDAQGQFAGYRGSASDITAERLLEAQLHQAQKLEAIGTLAGGIAHDFNNLLQPIIGFTKLSLENLDADGKPARNLQAVLSAANRAKDIVAKILLFARNSPYAPTHLNLVPLFQEVANLLRETLPANITITQDIEDDTIPAYADASQFHQVLLNLCINAGHAMPDGGTLTLSLGQRQLSRLKTSTGATLTGTYIRLAVADTGVGMSEETVARIFEPFFSTRPTGQGTGLGLSSVLGIVENHRGAMHVRSALGKGSVFEVYLPRDGWRPEVEPEPSTSAVENGLHSVLVLDDDPMITMLNKTVLERHGYQVLAHTDSEEALAAFRAAPDETDLIVTDLTMPGLNGEQFISAVREMRPDIPIVLCTGYESQALLDGAADMRTVRIFTKPMEPKDLLAAIQESFAEVAAQGGS